MKYIHSFTNQGKREYQEDSLALGDNFLLVTDGVGGHAKGDVASKMVADIWTEEIQNNNNLDIFSIVQHAIKRCNESLLSHANSHSATIGMATTVAVVFEHDNKIYGVHIGDSRIYHFAKNGHIKWRSKDHSLVQELLTAGVITEEEAKNHPRRNVVTKVLQAKENIHTEASIHVFDNLEAGDIIMVCTDGVTESWTDDELEQVISNSHDTTTAFKPIEKKCAANSSDNNTAVIYLIDEVKESTSINLDKGITAFDRTDQELGKRKRTSLLSLLFITLLSFIGLGLLLFYPNPFNTKEVSTVYPKAQKILAEEINKGMQKVRSKRGMGIIMEVKTGKIIACYNSDYEINDFELSVATIANAKVEPSGFMKAPTSLSLFEDGYLNPKTKVNAHYGTLNLDSLTIHDSEKHGLDTTSFKEAFAIGSNVVFADLANKYYNQSSAHRMKFLKNFSSFGINKITEIRISSERKPIYHHTTYPESIRSQIPWIAHGYGIQMTPLQILNFYNTVANDGTALTPSYRNRKNKFTGKIYEQSSSILYNKIASPSSIKNLQFLLRHAVTNGTGKIAKSNKVSISGKTATTRINADNPDEEAKFNAAFCGYFPSENPKYSMIIFIEDPKELFYASMFVAPVFKYVVEEMMK